MNRLSLLLPATVLALAACHGMHHHDGHHAHEGAASADMKPTQGNTAAGKVEFHKHGNAVHVRAQLSGLTPGKHGFHVHEKGDCSAPDGMSAGGHFNPTGAPHGHPHQGPHHAGDMPMLEADAQGNARLHAELPGVALEGEAGLVGRSVIVHADPDDFKTQPTGNSGKRVACGVVAKAAN